MNAPRTEDGRDAEALARLYADEKFTDRGVLARAYLRLMPPPSICPYCGQTMPPDPLTSE